MPPQHSSSPTRGGQGRARYVGAGPRGRREVWIERDGVRRLAQTPTDDAPARYCRALTYDVIAHLPERDFELSGADVLAWLERT